MGHLGMRPFTERDKYARVVPEWENLARTVKSMSKQCVQSPVRTAADLGAALRARRKAQGLTLEQVSGLSGLGMRFLSELERGKATAELGKALEVAALLGLDCFLMPRSSSGLPSVISTSD
jgi:HTH-type transcriptional regulator / antitoxin HipB